MREQSAGGAARRPRSRRGQGEQLRREILGAVNRLLAEWGSAERLTVRAVAQEVGVAAPSIYLHFSDKAELVWTALSDKYAQLADVMRTADAGEPPDEPLRRLRAQTRAYCCFAVENPGHYRLMYETEQPAVDDSRIGRHPARLVSGSLRAAVARCAEAGYGLALPREQLAMTLWAGLHGIVALSHSIFSDASTKKFSLDMAEGLLTSLVTPPGTPSPASCAEPGDTAALRRIRELLGPEGEDEGEG